MEYDFPSFPVVPSTFIVYMVNQGNHPLKAKRNIACCLLGIHCNMKMEKSWGPAVGISAARLPRPASTASGWNKVLYGVKI